MIARVFQLALIHRAIVLCPLGWWLAYWWQLWCWRAGALATGTHGLGGPDAPAWTAVSLGAAALVVVMVGAASSRELDARRTVWWAVLPAAVAILHGGKAWVRWTQPMSTWRAASVEPGFAFAVVLTVVALLPALFARGRGVHHRSE